MKRILPVLIAGLVCVAEAGPMPATGPSIVTAGQNPAERVVLQTPSRTGFTYQLLRGLTPATATQVVGIKRGTGGLLEFADPASVTRRGYYRIRQVPDLLSTDTDGDLIPDATELANPVDNPLNPARPINAADGAVFVKDYNAFLALSHRDNFPGAPQVREMKFLITGVDGSRWNGTGPPGPRIYFLNNNRHIYHYYFATDVLGYTKDLNTFNNETYFTTAGRKQIAGSFIAYEQYQPNGRTAGIYAMEFWPTDPVAFQHVKMAWDLVTQAMPWLNSPVAYHPAGQTQHRLLETEKALYDNSLIRTITSEQLFSDVAFSALNPGVGFGRLRIASGTEALTVRDVVVLRTLPNDLTHVAGIISEAPQTALSHINLKAKQNSTPNAYVRDAESRADVQALVGKNVRYEVTGEGILLREATQAEVEANIEALRPPLPQFPPRDLTKKTIDPIASITFTMSTAFGAKTTNVAELKRFMPAGSTPDGHGIPFYFYDEYMKHNGFYDLMRSYMDHPLFANDASFRAYALSTFQGQMRAGTMPAWMYDAITAVQAKFPVGTPIRARSSTNNEDLPGFNGAGLYDSYTHRPDEGHLSKTVRQVWASLWNFRAFEERDFYRIDHFTAAMGVLLHPNTDDEQANGVAVSKNLIDPNWRGYYVNAQLGEDLVTNPTEGAIPEEFLIAALLGTERYETQYVSFSNRIPAGTTLLTKDQAWLLADRLNSIHSRFRSLYNAFNDPDFAMEIEFKITFDGKLFIKQARPWVD